MFTIKNFLFRVDEMTQWVKVLLIRLDDLNLIFGACVVEGEN